MSDALPRLTTALADRYRIERELGSAGAGSDSAVKEILGLHSRKGRA